VFFQIRNFWGICGGYKERVRGGKYGGDIMYSYIKMEK
jgi:hypothetical protein